MIVIELLYVQGSLSSTGLVVCSRFPRFSHLYTLTISSSEPKSICANESVQLTKSVTRWSLSLSPLHSGIQLLFSENYTLFQVY